MKSSRRHFLFHKVPLIILSTIIVLILAIIDDATGHEIRVSLFYLIPIMLVAFFVSRSVGVYLSVLSAAAWFMVDLRMEFVQYTPVVHVWNTIVRLSFFVFITYGISLLVTAKRKQRELSDFIIHDLKTPLTNMMVGMQAVSDIVKDTNKRALNLSEMTVASGNRMIGMIQSLTDLSKMESGKYSIKTEDVSVGELVDSSIDSVSLWAEKTEINIKTEIDDSELLLKTDKMLVYRILTNLLSNALKVSSSGSWIKLVANKKSDHLVSFCVIDNGPGIEEKWQHSVFDKFHQLEARKGGVALGSGLGLTFCKLGAKALGGDISLESVVGKGTNVKMEIPIKS